MIFEECPARALAIFAHPDDPEVACAGTLAAWTKAGSEVHLIIANSGDKGRELAEDDRPLADVRREEAERAAGVLHLASLQLLGCPDGELENTSELRSQLIERVRFLRPEIVIAPDPTAVFFGDSYVNHHDHRALGWAVLDISGSMAGGARYAPHAGPPHQIASLLLAGTLDPDTWVDIGNTLNEKLAALRCHESQLDGAGADVLADLIEARAEDAGRAAGVRYAEGFRRVSFRS